MSNILTPATIAQYNYELDKAIIAFLNGDEETYDKFLTWSGHADKIKAHPVLKRVTIAKMCTARPSIPMKYRVDAKKFLLSMGMFSEDDGDVDVRIKTPKQADIYNPGV